MRIRSIEMSDLAAFKALRLEALKNHPEAFGTDYHESLGEPDSNWIERVRDSVNSDTNCLFLADAEDELAGMLGVFRSRGAKNRHAGTVWGVYVRPAYRGQKLVDRMMHEALEWCTQRGIRIVRLSATNSTAAVRCYLRCGFVVYGVSPEEIRVDETYYDEVLMYRRVANA